MRDPTWTSQMMQSWRKLSELITQITSYRKLLSGPMCCYRYFQCVDYFFGYATRQLWEWNTWPCRSLSIVIWLQETACKLVPLNSSTAIASLPSPTHTVSGPWNEASIVSFISFLFCPGWTAVGTSRYQTLD